MQTSNLTKMQEALFSADGTFHNSIGSWFKEKIDARAESGKGLIGKIAQSNLATSIRDKAKGAGGATVPSGSGGSSTPSGTTVNDEPKKGINWLLWGGIGGGLLVATIVTIMIVKNKNK